MDDGIDGSTVGFIDPSLTEISNSKFRYVKYNSQDCDEYVLQQYL